MQSTKVSPLLGIDFHAPGACESDGIYAYLPKPEAGAAGHEAAAEWARRFAASLGEKYAASDFGRVARYASRWETPNFTRGFHTETGAATLSFETPYAACGETLMTREAYREAGARIAEAILTHLPAHA